MPNLNPLDPTFTKKRGRGRLLLTKTRPPCSVPQPSGIGESKLERSRFAERLNRCVHKKLTVQLGPVPRTLALHGKQARREWLVPLHGEARHIPDDERKLLRADISGQRYGIKTSAAHRAVA